MAPADTEVDNSNTIKGPNLVARYRSDFELVTPEQVQYIDVAPSQMVGVSAGLIPFLEHDDANLSSLNRVAAWIFKCVGYPALRTTGLLSLPGAVRGPRSTAQPPSG